MGVIITAMKDAQKAEDFSPRAWIICLKTCTRPRPCSPAPISATCRAMRSAAITTSCCAAVCRRSRTGSQAIGEFGYRVFTDSAPVLEKALAEKAGLGLIGKHTNLIHRRPDTKKKHGEIY